MAVRLTTSEISRMYDRFARWYDLAEGVPDLLGVRKLRERILKRAFGRVLEVAVGTGKNLNYYPEARGLTAVDVSCEMLNIARARANRLSIDVAFLMADAQRLPFSDESFDTVASSLTTCTFPDPVAALGEMARVCRPRGRILLLEHGRSNREWLGRLQDRRADRHAKQLGCHWNREPLELVRQAGLKVEKAESVFLGIFYQIEARPSVASS